MDLFQSYTTGDTGAYTCYGARWLAQTFTVENTHTVMQISVKVYRTGSPSTVTASVKATDSETGKPTGSDLAYGTIDGDTFTDDGNNPVWEDITLTVTYGLEVDTTYAIVLKAPSGNVSNTVHWRYTESGSYAGGKMMVSNDSGSTWSIGETWDAMFKEYGEGLYIEGTKTATGVGYAWLSTEDYEGEWPRQKPDIDPDDVWDEDAQQWVTVNNDGGGRYREQIVAIGHNSDGTGCIYYGEN